MRQLLDLARENVPMKRLLTRAGEEAQAVQRLLLGLTESTASILATVAPAPHFSRPARREYGP